MRTTTKPNEALAKLSKLINEKHKIEVMQLQTELDNTGTSLDKQLSTASDSIQRSMEDMKSMFDKISQISEALKTLTNSSLQEVLKKSKELKTSYDNSSLAALNGQLKEIATAMQSLKIRIDSINTPEIYKKAGSEVNSFYIDMRAKYQDDYKLKQALFDKVSTSLATVNANRIKLDKSYQEISTQVSTLLQTLKAKQQNAGLFSAPSPPTSPNQGAAGGKGPTKGDIK